MIDMLVKIEVELTVHPSKKHDKLMRESAESLTNNSRSVVISRKGTNALVAEFTMKKARQIDVVDKIGDAFSEYMEDYSDSAISFPERRMKPYQNQKKTDHV